MYKNPDTQPITVKPQPTPQPISEEPYVPEEPSYNEPSYNEPSYNEPQYVSPPYTEGSQQRPPYGYYPSCPPMNSCNPYTYARPMAMTDYGPNPFSVDICQAALQNNNYRTALWTGHHLQVTLMCIPPCGEIGQETHGNTDQVLCVIDGQGMLVMGDGQDRNIIGSNCCICVPAGTNHNIINTGNMPLKLFSCYAPPEHSAGDVQMRRMDTMGTMGTMGSEGMIG